MIDTQQTTLNIAKELLHPEIYVRKHPELLNIFYNSIKNLTNMFIDMSHELKLFADIHSKFLIESHDFIKICYKTELKDHKEERHTWYICEEIITNILLSLRSAIY